MQVRPPIDDFERLLIRVFSALPSVTSIWVRETRLPETTGKTHIRSVWLILRGRAELVSLEALAKEIETRFLNHPWVLEIHYLVNAAPPAAIAPACVWRRS